MLKTGAKLQHFFVSAKKHVYFFYFISHLDLKRVLHLVVGPSLKTDF